nr:MAG TPA: hypothetical protein [Caudoviricetes sp.]
MATVPTATPGKACSSHSLIFFHFSSIFAAAHHSTPPQINTKH